MAPYTGDPTWDYVDAPMMAILTFFSAPWVMGVLYNVRRTPVAHLLVAASLWMLSASWCYDGYQLLLLWASPFMLLAAWSIIYFLV